MSEARARRPLRSRVWFYRPFSYTDWRPFSTGGDEFNWHTVVIGLPVTGQIVIATRECDGTGECAWYAEECPQEAARRWPIDLYGHNTVGECLNSGCYCRESE